MSSIESRNNNYTSMLKEGVECIVLSLTYIFVAETILKFGIYVFKI